LGRGFELCSPVFFAFDSGVDVEIDGDEEAMGEVLIKEFWNYIQVRKR
jgi:hypothetical protein